MSKQVLFGFHAVTVRLKSAPKSVIEIHVDATRRDQRMRQFVDRARDAGAKIIDSDDDRLQKLSGSHRHQGVAARVETITVSSSLDDTLDAAAGPLLDARDGVSNGLQVTDVGGPHQRLTPGGGDLLRERLQGGPDPAAHARYLAINAAYEVLSDPARRATYDNFISFATPASAPTGASHSVRNKRSASTTSRTHRVRAEA